jgi:hypothetical protein
MGLLKAVKRNTNQNTVINMEELNIEEMTELRGGGHHHKSGINISIENVSVTQSNYASQSNSASNVGSVNV